MMLIEIAVNYVRQEINLVSMFNNYLHRQNVTCCDVCSVEAGSNWIGAAHQRHPAPRLRARMELPPGGRSWHPLPGRHQ